MCICANTYIIENYNLCQENLLLLARKRMYISRFQNLIDREIKARQPLNSWSFLLFEWKAYINNFYFLGIICINVYFNIFYLFYSSCTIYCNSLAD